METKQIIVDGLVTRYISRGKGPVVLMLHGWGDSLMTFQELAKQLNDKYQVISLDLPGFGQTQAPKLAWGVADYASFVALFLTKLGVEQPYAVIGHSHGGAVAIHALGAKKVTANKLVLLASAGVRNKTTAKKTVLKAGAKTAKVLTAVLPKATRQRLRNRLYGAIGSDMTVVPHMEETFRKVVGEDQTSQASNITIPSLLIYGTADRATLPQDGLVLKNCINGAQLELIPDAGHFVHHDNLPRVSQLIRGFLG